MKVGATTLPGRPSWPSWGLLETLESDMKVMEHGDNADGAAFSQFLKRLQILRGKLVMEIGDNAALTAFGVLSAAGMVLASEVGKVMPEAGVAVLTGRLEALSEAFNQEGLYTRAMVVDEAIERLQALSKRNPL